MLQFCFRAGHTVYTQLLELNNVCAEVLFVVFMPR